MQRYLLVIRVRFLFLHFAFYFPVQLFQYGERFLIIGKQQAKQAHRKRNGNDFSGDIGSQRKAR